MSSLINKVKSKVTSDHNDNNEGGEEQQFSTQPHPAKSNNPADLQNPAPSTGMGLNNNEQIAPFRANEPPTSDPQVMEAVGKQDVKGRDELRARQEELNR